MPYESLTCPKCGSADCQQVKPDTHFCNHCDNVFRYVPPAGASGGAATCNTCGVLAIGRCADCSQAFCATHQGRNAEMMGYFAQCATCTGRAEQARRDHEQGRRDHDARFGSSFFSEGSARRTLLDAGVATVDFHRIRGETQSLRFGRYKRVVTVEPIDRGWLLGECLWYHYGSGTRTGTDMEGPFLTILMDAALPLKEHPGLPYGGQFIRDGLLPVREDTTHGGYEYLSLASPEIRGFGVATSRNISYGRTDYESLSRRVYDLAANATAGPGHLSLPAQPR